VANKCNPRGPPGGVGVPPPGLLRSPPVSCSEVMTHPIRSPAHPRHLSTCLPPVFPLFLPCLNPASSSPFFLWGPKLLQLANSFPPLPTKVSLHSSPHHPIRSPAHPRHLSTCLPPVFPLFLPCLNPASSSPFFLSGPKLLQLANSFPPLPTVLIAGR
jgi:hypothetical protein